MIEYRGSRWPAVGVALGTLVLSGLAVGPAQAATTPAPLSMVAATGTVTAERYAVKGEPAYVSLDLGMHLIAGRDAFEVRARRAGYDKPITATRTVVKNGRKTQVKLPAGTVKDFTGLKDFTTITIKDKAGKTVTSYQTSFCGNSYSTGRTRRDAPATSPYPADCGGYSPNPFRLGAVWGVQAGWDSAVDDRPRSETQLSKLTAGTYTATATVNKKYRSMFGIPAAKAAATVAVKVVDVKTDEGGIEAARAADARAAGPVAAAGHDEHGLHTEQGDASRQVSSYLSEFRAAASRPATVKATPQGPKPDLRSLPAWGISLTQGEDEKTGKTNGKWYVNFGATVWNAGTSPLVVDGFRRTGTEKMDAYQYFFDAKGKQVGSKAAGTMQWDPREGHMHWHFTDFAQYNLLAADKKLAVRSGKEAFCLANTDAVDYTIKGAKWRPDNTSLATSCGANTVVAVREVLDIGNGDTYSQDRPGQSFDITNLKNGTYYIQVKANPSNHLAELTTKNNTSLRKIIIGGTAKKRTLTVPAVHGITG
ncbi:lysyl oxidase family protein [Actinoplanes rectilineatus]|uniref:lysyl oxidase family protein n=1 Tax=Actinoplanes rectilineatus TaxID=113571 RepID=UPI0005F293CC|nr:lysyl oxidase family protein [Actinoplanes rectilineatus]